MKPPESRSRRFLKLAGMTTSVATRYAGSRIRSLIGSKEDSEGMLSRAHEASGRRIAETLGELKGAVMKVGQMASIGTDWLPPELAEPLASLQKEAPPVDFEVIAGQIESELGAPPERLFDSFDEEPFASASIGQVHRARTDDGREVVVKVQYPGVDRSVDSDLSQLRLALGAAGLMRMRRKVVKTLFAELRRTLHEELDYTNEAQNVRLFREMHAGDDFVVLPEVVGERSAQRVLTLTYEPGTMLADVADDSSLTRQDRDAIGRNLARLLSEEIFDHLLVHGDPNPANFAVRPGGTLVLYDFGCVKRLKPTLVQGYKDIVRAFLDKDYEAVDQAMGDIGARTPGTPPVDAEVYQALASILRPLFQRDTPFDFAEANLQLQLMALAPRFHHLSGAFQPPVDGVLVNRVMAGHYGNLRRLGATLRLMDLVEPYLAAPTPGLS